MIKEVIEGVLLELKKAFDPVAYKGEIGEVSVARKLGQLNEYKKIINDIYINDQGKSRQIDHIVITKHGVFVIETKKKKYVLEVNFYNGGGSKPNETARAYTGIAPKINQVGNYEFVWITDGDGWNSAKPEIKQAYETIPSIYNLSNISEFIEKIKAEGLVSDTLI